MCRSARYNGHSRALHHTKEQTTVVESILSGLNPQQRQAVMAGDGPTLVVAGPGSGKTRVLTHRIAYLVKVRDVPAWQVMAVTFTNKAAHEMKDRVVALLGVSGPLDGLNIGTFHSRCALILRREAANTPFTADYAIFDTEDQLRVVKQVVAELGLDPKRHNPRSLLYHISAAKNELLTAEAYQPQDYRQEVVRRAYLRYDARLREYNARDFDDLLLHTVQLFREQPDVLARYQERYRYILVDEFQDTNLAQYTLVRLLAGERRNLFVVGDPDQSIYAFRGADYRNVRRFQQDYPDAQVILLEENYRSHQAILDAAMGVINQNTDRTPKRLFTKRKQGPPIVLHEAYSEDDEARFVVETIAELQAQGYAPRDFAVMYRTHAQSRALEDRFRRYGMPYRLVGATSFYGRKEIKDVVAYLRLVHNPRDTISLRRIINVPTRGIGQRTLQTLTQWAEDLRMTPSEALMLLLDEQVDSPFTPRARKRLVEFAALVESWRALQEHLAPDELMTRILNDTAYLAYLDDGTQQGEARIENVLELRGHAETYRGLPLVTFLEDISLVSDVDTRAADENRPSLMTLHAAKGLEFPVVFIVGMEENILPHARSIAAERDPRATPEQKRAAREALEEERRLLYVGITRAKERLYLVYATTRSLYGDSRANLPSRFLYDIPPEVCQGARLQRAAPPTPYRRPTASPSPRRKSASTAPRVASPKKTRFKGGDVVWHAIFGEGVVVSSRMSSGVEIVEVLFPGETGHMRIVADFLKAADA